MKIFHIKIKLYVLILLLLGGATSLYSQGEVSGSQREAGESKATTSNIPKQEVRDTLDPEKVHIFHADQLYGNDEGPEAIRKMSGDVVLYQDSSFFYCDSAILVGQRVTAAGNILIQQGDSLRIYADSLEYHGGTRIARLFGEVVLDHKGRRLFTDSLSYSLKDKIARYLTGGLLVSEGTRLKSRAGYYNVDQELAFFRDSVQVVDDQFELTADSLYFLSEAQRALFAGPTLIDMDDKQIYCEDGFFDIATEEAVFSVNARYKSPDERVRADSIIIWSRDKAFELRGDAYYAGPDEEATGQRIYHSDSTEITELEGDAFFRQENRQVKGAWIQYNGKTGAILTEGRTSLGDSTGTLVADRIDYNENTGYGTAVGRVVYTDSVENWALVCDSLVYREDEEYVQAMGTERPLMKFLVEGDTLFLSADTILSYLDTILPDTGRILKAFHRVRLFKSDLQGVADSMSFQSADSVFRFFREPLMWSDTTQFEGDTIGLVLRDSKIDRMLLRRNAFIVQSPDLEFFNQIKGNWVTAYFDTISVNKLLVEGNAESIYYGQDEKGAYVGVNKSISSSFWVYFKDKKVDRILFLRKPNASLLPMKDAMAQPPTLEGYHWEVDSRPKNKSDIR